MRMNNLQIEMAVKQMEEHIQIGKKLECVVDDRDTKEFLEATIQYLGKCLTIYDGHRKANQLREEGRKRHEEALEMMTLVCKGDRKEAEKRLREPLKDPKYDNKIYNIMGYAYAVIGIIVQPASQKAYEYCTGKYWTAKQLIELNKLNYQRQKETEETERRNLRNMHDLEFQEAALEQKIKRMFPDMKDDNIMALIEMPHIIPILAIESLKDKYAPWM
jgi:hypothetical protein